MSPPAWETSQVRLRASEDAETRESILAGAARMLRFRNGPGLVSVSESTTPEDRAAGCRRWLLVWRAS